MAAQAPPENQRADVLRVAAIQMTSTEDIDRNLAVADRLTRAAAGDGARLVVLPEKWSVLGTAEHLAAGAQKLSGEAISWARAIAAELTIDLIAGSIVERRGDSSKFANTSVHANPAGELLAIYRKLHLFDVDVGCDSYRESDTDAAGAEIVTSTLADGTDVGLSICYDLRFPELYRALVSRAVRIIVVPSAFTLATTRDHWELLLRARAVENQVFVIAPNQVGTHPPGLKCGGRSMIIDPWGLVLAQATDAEGYVTADLDYRLQDEVRSRVPALRHRRPDVFDPAAGTPGGVGA